MTRTTLLTITLLSSLATPFVVSAATSVPEAQTVTVAQKAPAATVEAPKADTGCRKVRIVYPGYGPVNNACPTVEASR